MGKDQIKAGIGIIFIIALFVVVSIFVQRNLDYVRVLIGNGFFSILTYIFLLIFETVIAPVSAVPLLPVASGIWGWFWTAIFSIIGWTLGAVIAFALARSYGVPLVKKFISMKKLEKFENFIPKKNIFWGIAFLRMAVPVDVLSYALGLFSRIKFRDYTWATLIGIAPIAFVLSYVGTLSFYFQMIALFIAVDIILAGLIIELLIKRKKIKIDRKK